MLTDNGIPLTHRRCARHARVPVFDLDVFVLKIISNDYRKNRFFAEVRVNDNTDEVILRGKTGVIIYGYSVVFEELEYSYNFDADQASATGRKFKREDFYDGSRICVSRDGKRLPPK